MTKSIGLHHRGFRSVLSFVVALLLIGSISYLGIRTYQASHAASGASIYVSPDTATVANGSTLSVTIRENSGTDSVNSVQASLNYDSNKLQYVSITEGDSFPVIAANSTGTPGVIRVGRGNSDGSVTGDKPIVTINFKVIGSSGDAAINVDKAYSLLVRSVDNQDILQNVGSGNYTISSDTGNISTKPIMYITPASSSYLAGATVAATVRLNSYTASVTTIEAAIKYPTDKLQYVSVTEGGIYATQQRTNNANGVVDIIRGIAGGSNGINGDNPVVTINFIAIASGSAALTFAGASSAYDNSGTGANILNIAGSTGSTYTLSAADGTTPPPTNEDPPPVSDANNNDQPAGDVTPPSNAVKVATTKHSGSVSLTTAKDGSVLTELSGKVDLTPVIDYELLARNPNESITKVEYYIDGKLISTQQTAPYKFTFDTNSLRNGQYSMVIKTYYSSGTVDTRADKILINNKVTLAYVMRHYTVNIGIVIAVLALLALILWKLVIPRAAAKHARDASYDHDVLYGFSGGAVNDGGLGGPVAGDPTVISPSSAPDSSSTDVNVTGPPLQTSTAAMTTSALPMTGAEQPVSSEPQIIQSTPVAPAGQTSPILTPTAITSTPTAPAARTISVTTPIEVITPSLHGSMSAAPAPSPTNRPPAVPGTSITDYQFQPSRPAVTVPVTSVPSAGSIISPSIQTFRPDISPSPQTFPPQHT